MPRRRKDSFRGHRKKRKKKEKKRAIRRVWREASSAEAQLMKTATISLRACRMRVTKPHSHNTRVFPLANLPKTAKSRSFKFKNKKKPSKSFPSLPLSSRIPAIIKRKIHRFRDSRVLTKAREKENREKNRRNGEKQALPHLRFAV